MGKLIFAKFITLFNILSNSVHFVAGQMRIFPTSNLTPSFDTASPSAYGQAYPTWYIPYVSRRAVVELLGPSTVRGKVYFLQPGPFQSVSVTGHITGLRPNGVHAWHVHEYGDTLEGCQSTGDHLSSVQNNQHGGPSDPVRHVGDLGNLFADGLGNVQLSQGDSTISLNGENSIVGRALVVHENPDDLGRGNTPESLATGTSGSRVACGVIGRARLF